MILIFHRMFDYLEKDCFVNLDENQDFKKIIENLTNLPFHLRL